MKQAYGQNYLEFELSSALRDQLRALSHDFMTVFDLSHVWVSQYYFDGRYLDITNDLKWKEIMVTHNHYGDFAKMFLEPLKGTTSKSLLRTWQSEPTHHKGLLNRIHHHGINSGFNIVRIYSDHIENFGFGSTKGGMEIINNLPDREELDMFCLSLREGILHSDKLLNSVRGDTGQPFKPRAMATGKGYSYTTIPEFFTFDCNGIQDKLSRRELICLALFARGYSIKECGYHLSISPRTAEYHLNQIRSKFNNAPKLDLIKSFTSSPLSCIDPFLLLNTA